MMYIMTWTYRYVNIFINTITIESITIGELSFAKACPVHVLYIGLQHVGLLQVLHHGILNTRKSEILFRIQCAACTLAYSCLGS